MDEFAPYFIAHSTKTLEIPALSHLSCVVVFTGRIARCSKYHCIGWPAEGQYRFLASRASGEIYSVAKRMTLSDLIRLSHASCNTRPD